MGKGSNEIEFLLAKLKELERENDNLKSLLLSAGIDYASAVQRERVETATAFVPDQGSSIVPVEITRNHARQFFSYFWGRLLVLVGSAYYPIIKGRILSTFMQICLLQIPQSCYTMLALK